MQERRTCILQLHIRDMSRNVGCCQLCSAAVQVLLNDWGDGLYFCTQFLLNTVPASKQKVSGKALATVFSLNNVKAGSNLQVEAVLVGDQIHGQSKMAKPARPTNLQDA